MLFILFNLVYLIYMQGFLPQVIYYACIALFCAYGLFILLIKNRNEIVIKDLGFFNGIRNIFIIIVSFWIISTVIQFINGDVQLYLYVELFTILMPALVLFCIVNVDKDNINYYIYILFFRTIIQFFLEQGANFSLANILSINWSDSTSSTTETSLAHIFCLFVILFLYKKKYILSLVSTFFCIISFKRVAFIVCIASWIITPFIPNKKMSRVSFWLISVLLVLSPFFILWIYSKSGNEFFLNNFGLDLNEFTMGRYNLIQMVEEHFQGKYNGLGTIPNYFDSLGGYYATLSSFHCDILRIYFECTIVGVFIFVMCLMNLAKRNWKIFYVLFYLFVELIVSHFLGRFIEWIIFYYIYYLFENKQEMVVEQKR